jgi:hypothetical protein
VRQVEYMGADSFVYVATRPHTRPGGTGAPAGPDRTVLVRQVGPTTVRDGDEIGLRFSAGAAHFFRKDGSALARP